MSEPKPCAAPTAYGAPCGAWVGIDGDPCEEPAIVSTTYRRKCDGYVQHTHDCPKHVGTCNEQWEYVRPLQES